MARNTCCLCLDEIKEKDILRTQCGHEYHKKCFVNLTIVNKYKDCSMCRQPFEKEWFLNSLDNFKEYMNIENEQEQIEFDRNWKWWIDYFEGQMMDQIDDDENWNDFIRMVEGDEEEVLEGFNPGARPRLDVNPEMVVWEGEIEDLFEEAAMMERRQEALEAPPEVEIAPEVLERIEDFLREAENADENENED